MWILVAPLTVLWRDRDDEQGYAGDCPARLKWEFCRLLSV